MISARYRELRLACCALIVVAAACLSIQAASKLDVTLDRREVFLGDAARLTVTVSGSVDVAPPVIPATEGLDVKLAENTPRTMVQVVNGRRTSHLSRTFIYTLTPTLAETFSLGPIETRIKGKRLSHKGVSLKGIGSNDDPDVLLRLLSTHETVMVDEPFQITFKVLLKRLKGRYQNSDPMLGESAPHLTLPFLDTVPDGLIGPDTKPILQRALVSKSKAPGFAVNEFTVRNDPFSMFNFDPLTRSRAARFMFERKAVREGNIDYYEYSVSLEYTPEKEGRYTFEAPLFKGNLVTAVAVGGRANARPVFVRGTPLVVNVVPPPQQGRPKSFIGAIGTNLSVYAELSTQTCNVGDPLELTLGLDGDFSVKNIDPPAIEQQESLTRRFRVYADSVRIETGEKQGVTYRYTIKPKEAGTYELPPIEVAFYDRQTRAYRIAKTEPIPIRAIKVAEVGTDWVVNDSTNRPGMTQLSSAVNDEPAPMTVIRSGAEPQGLFRPRHHLPIALLGPVCLFLVGLTRFAQHATRTLNIGGRTRSAASRARHALNQLSQDDAPSAVAGQLRDALASYLQDRFKLTRLPQSPVDVKQALDSVSSSAPDASAPFCDVFERCFNAQFTRPSRDDITELIAQASSAIDTLDSVSSRRKSNSSSTRAVLLLVFSGLCIAQADAASMEQRFMWDEANTTLSRARSPQEFSGAALLYRKMLTSRIANGPVLYNLGIAELNARHFDDALIAFQRAERYTGSSADLTRNMRLAVAAGDETRSSSLSWVRTPLFWHYALSGSVRMSIAVAAFSLCWVAWILLSSGAPLIGRPLLMLSILALAVFGSSGITTVSAERNACKHDVLYERHRLQTPMPDAGDALSAEPREVSS